MDIILFSEVMYCNKRGISGENPQHIHFIKNIAKPLFESWGYEVVILRSDRDFVSFFNRVIERPTKHMNHKGKKFGFPAYGQCGIKRDLKMKPIEEYYKSIDEPITQYVGICADEKRRLESMHKDERKLSLLEKYNYTEEMARELCIKYNLLSPGYQYSKRGGCWFCPNAKMDELRQIKEIYPDIWNEFVLFESEDNVAFNRFNIFGKTLKEINLMI